MSSIEEEIRAVSAAWDVVLLTNDSDAVASFMTDDWVYVAPDGITTRAELIGSIAAGTLAHLTMAPVGDQRVVVHGDTALLTMRRISSGSWEGKPYVADEWTTEIFVRRDGRWLCALSHKAPVAEA